MDTATEQSLTKANMQAYFETHDIQYIAEDAVFINMATGERHEGRDEIAGMLNYIYHVAFDAKASVTNSIITEEKAMLEGMFIGKHIANFAGIEATQKQVNVPLCVSYSLKHGLIQEARIYMQANVMMEQLNS